MLYSAGVRDVSTHSLLSYFTHLFFTFYVDSCLGTQGVRGWILVRQLVRYLMNRYVLRTKESEPYGRASASERADMCLYITWNHKDLSSSFPHAENLSSRKHFSSSLGHHLESLLRVFQQDFPCCIFSQIVVRAAVFKGIY